MRHIFSIMIAALFLFYPSHGFTQVKEIVSEGTYNMGDAETPAIAESRALLNAKRIALEQAGTYVESYTKVENFQLNKDEIQVLSSGIIEIEILDKKRTIIDDGFRFWVKIKARINPDRIQEMAKKVKEKSVIEDYKKIQEAYDKSRREVEELKKQLAQTKNKNENKKIEAKISDNEMLFQANEWFEKGQQHLYKNELDKAIKAYTSAIAINPDNANAYHARATCYRFKKQFDRAIEDYNKAIAINPNNAGFYRGRGVFYHDKLLEEVAKAIAVNPNLNKDAYFKSVIAGARKGMGSMAKAISDYEKACDMGDEDACGDFRELQGLLQN